MGRIKTTLIKRLTTNLIKHHRDKLGAEFEQNKQVVGELLDVSSKKMRNTIAGYSTRLMKKQEE